MALPAVLRVAKAPEAQGLTGVCATHKQTQRGASRMGYGLGDEHRGSGKAGTGIGRTREKKEKGSR